MEIDLFLKAVREYGVSAIVIYMLIQTVQDLIKKLKSPAEKDELESYRITQALEKLTENMIRQTSILEEMRTDHKELGRAITRLEGQLRN